jgi:hypothetical protein
MKKLRAEDLRIDVVGAGANSGGLNLEDRGAAAEEIHGSSGDRDETSSRYNKDHVCRPIVKSRT